MSFMHRSGTPVEQPTGGQKAWAWCEPCGRKYVLEFHTIDGRLYQRPLPCGHEYDPKASPEGPVSRRCVDCHCEISEDLRSDRCEGCRVGRAKKMQKARNDRRDYERRWRAADTPEARAARQRPRPCATPECATMVEGRTKFCGACAIERRNARDRARYARQRRAS